MTKRHRKKWVDALSLVLPVLLFFAVLNCFTTYLYYQDYQCKMDILTEVAAGAETTGMDVAAGWLKGNDHQANEQGKQLLEQYGYWENKGTSFYVRFRQNIMITGCTSAVLCLSLLTFLFYRKKVEAKESRKRLEQLEQILIAFRENHFEVVPDTEDHAGQERLKFQLEAIGHHIQLLQEEARAEKESTKEMVSDISHQLKTPLAVLKTQASVALASDDPQLWRESLQAMRATLDDTVLLTERLLQLATVKQRDQAFAVINLPEIVRNSCFSRIAQARSKHIDLGYEGEQSAVQVAGDSVLLGELCANLLDNAIRYTPEYGTVTLSLHRDGDAVLLSVEDSGPGIDDQQVHQALMPFRRLDNAGAIPGAGLGLALVNDIARLHRSHLQLSRSESLGGLKATLRLPTVASE